MLRFFIVFLIFIGLAGCQTAPVVNENSLFQRGVVIRDSGQYLTFRPCYVNALVPLVDDTGELERWFEQAPVALNQAYAEVMTYPDPEKAGIRRVAQLRLIGAQPRACEFELNGNYFRAAGDDPLWIADVREDGIRVQVYGSLRELLFPPVKPEQNGLTWTWRSDLTVQQGFSMALEMTEEVCYDRYGTRYPYSARLKVNEMDLRGCAREGNLGERHLVAAYRYDDQVLSLRVELKQGGELEFTDSRRGDTSAIASYLHGRWRLMDSGKVLLELQKDNGSKQLLFFERNADGSLLLRSGFRPYKAGLVLKRQQVLRTLRLPTQ